MSTSKQDSNTEQDGSETKAVAAESGPEVSNSNDPTEPLEAAGLDPEPASSAGHSSSDTEPSPVAASPRDSRPRPRETPALNPTPPAPRKSGGGLALLLALIALLGTGYVGYQQWQLQQQPAAEPIAAAVDPALSQALQKQSRQLNANAQQVSALSTRLEDMQSVNTVLRQQLLSMTERQALSEDVLTDLARDSAPSGPRMEIAEAEYLLLVGQTRLQLFGDVAGARLSLQLADQVLASSDDPLAGSVRGAISAEMDALNAVPVVDRIALQARLDRLSANVDEWPLLDGYDVDDPSERVQPWYTRVFHRLVDIRQVEIDDPLHPLGPAAARLGLRTHLALARLLLLQGREAEAGRSLGDAQKSLQLFDPTHPEVASAQRGMAEIVNLPLGAPLPTLGTALDEARRVRNLRGIANPQARRNSAAQSGSTTP